VKEPIKLSTIQLKIFNVKFRWKGDQRSHLPAINPASFRSLLEPNRVTSTLTRAEMCLSHAMIGALVC
jgi:hypothetical protein